MNLEKVLPTLISEEKTPIVDLTNNFKRVVVLADPHCGHLCGLTPPPWQYQESPFELDSKHNKFAHLQEELYDFYINELDKLKPIDIVIANGDLIDGSGHRSGGTELIMVDRLEQCKMAIYSLLETEAKNYVLIYGTGYHVGEQEDFENVIANKLPGVVKIGSHEWVDVNGVIFDCKHHCGGSQIPHGRHTAVAKERLWNVLWAEHEEQPKADIIIRSHVHYFHYCGGSDWLGLTTPALQGMGSKFGARRMSGHVDFGFLHFDVYEDGSYIWQPHLAKVLSQKSVPIAL